MSLLVSWDGMNEKNKQCLVRRLRSQKVLMSYWIYPIVNAGNRSVLVDLKSPFLGLSRIPATYC